MDAIYIGSVLPPESPAETNQPSFSELRQLKSSVFSPNVQKQQLLSSCCPRHIPYLVEEKTASLLPVAQPIDTISSNGTTTRAITRALVGTPPGVLTANTRRPAKVQALSTAAEIMLSSLQPTLVVLSGKQTIPIT